MARLNTNNPNRNHVVQACDITDASVQAELDAHPIGYGAEKVVFAVAGGMLGGIFGQVVAPYAPVGGLVVGAVAGAGSGWGVGSLAGAVGARADMMQRCESAREQYDRWEDTAAKPK